MSPGKSNGHRSLREHLLTQPHRQLPRCNDISPNAFPRSPAPKVPLKVGILKDVLARAASLGLSERDARNGLKLWCRGQRYWTCLIEGDQRVDLTGAMTGVVTAVEAEYGKSQENTRLTRRREQIAKNRNGPQR
ncbi:ProQ/FinO family protein [Caballeronia sp. LZ043]|uniref:ProQ/FinO family protein n=1 Tax=Caballeronia sp. LZ043 TaxID=3038569 RepID=UPI0028655835|nr:ProQ/FinO family protein [Caballeronia sp. LZ043]MDR5826127.1 ProQ/FinO family protein [Caballeronia sp. LZ043]